MEIQNRKSTLRQRVRAELNRLTSEQRAVRSLQARSLIEGQAAWKNAGTILFYAPLADEPDVWPLLSDALAAGKTIALPRFDPVAKYYTTSRIQNLAGDLRAGQFGIREPAEHCAEVPFNRLDLVLVPGVAFDESGHRLGRGRGFYDQLLTQVQGTTCGVAFDEQIVAEIPVEAHDIRLSYIVTPTRWLEAAG